MHPHHQQVPLQMNSPVVFVAFTRRSRDEKFFNCSSSDRWVQRQDSWKGRQDLIYQYKPDLIYQYKPESASVKHL